MDEQKLGVDTVMHRFNTDITGIAPPCRFTYMFYYEPHELCKIAAAEVQEFLKKQEHWGPEFGLENNENSNEYGKMIGVLVVLRPTGEGMLSAAGLALLGASACYSLATITVRVLARRDSTEAMVFWFLALLAVGAGLLAIPDWVPIRVADLWIFGLVGVSGALGQVVLTKAFQVGEASQLAPLEYTGLVWVVLLDLTVWGVLPDRTTWIGAAIIVTSGVYLLHRDRIRRPGKESPPVKPN